MAEHKDIMLMLGTVEKMKRKTFSDEERSRLLKSLRPFDIEDINAAEEPLCRRRYFPQYGDVIDAVEAVKAERLGKSSVGDTFDAGPEPDDANLALIRRHIGPVRFQSWFKGATVEIDDSVAVITVPGRAAVDWINKDLHVEVAAALKVNEAIAVLKGSTR